MLASRFAASDPYRRAHSQGPRRLKPLHCDTVCAHGRTPRVRAARCLPLSREQEKPQRAPRSITFSAGADRLSTATRSRGPKLVRGRRTVPPPRPPLSHSTSSSDSRQTTSSVSGRVVPRRKETAPNAAQDATVPRAHVVGRRLEHAHDRAIQLEQLRARCAHSGRAPQLVKIVQRPAYTARNGRPDISLWPNSFDS